MNQHLEGCPARGLGLRHSGPPLKHGVPPRPLPSRSALPALAFGPAPPGGWAAGRGWFAGPGAVGGGVVAAVHCS